MKTIIFATVMLVMLSSCSYNIIQGFYNVTLKEVERPEDVKDRYGDYTINSYEEEGEIKYIYEDELIEIIWIALPNQFSFVLENKSNHSIKIIWDEAAYIDENGFSKRVMHSGVRFVERNNPQAPTVVGRNAKVSDKIIPTDNVFFTDSWNIAPLFPNKARYGDSPYLSQNEQRTKQEALSELNVKSQNTIGKEVKVLLPLQIEDIINEYTFTFRVENFTISSTQ